jgi:hypothetical protein
VPRRRGASSGGGRRIGPGTASPDRDRVFRPREHGRPERAVGVGGNGQGQVSVEGIAAGASHGHTEDPGHTENNQKPKAMIRILVPVIAMTSRPRCV